MAENKRFVWFGTAVLVVCILIFITSVASSPFSWNAVMHYAGPLGFAVLGAAVLFMGLGRTVDEKVGLAFLVWFFASALLRGDLWLESSYLPLCEYACVFGLALPAARLLGKRSQTPVALAVLLLPTVLAGIAVLASLTVDAVYIPYIRTAAGVTGENGLRLQVGSHPNGAAAMFFAAMLMGMLLMSRTSRRWLRVLIGLMLAGLYMAIALTVSRTIMLQVAFTAAAIIFVLCNDRLPMKRWLRFSLGAAAALVTLAAVYKGFDLATQLASWMKIQAARAESLVDERPLMADLFTMTGRTNIFGWIFEMIRQNPRVLLFGATPAQLSEALNWAFHTHNAYLQCLVMCGIPGLAMAVYFSVRTLWAALRVIFSNRCFSSKLLVILPLAMLPNAISEVFLFADGMALYNAAFFFLLGFAIREAQPATQV